MFKKTGFNWNRFYDELEQGDPARFPYWMYFLHEVGDHAPERLDGDCD